MIGTPKVGRERRRQLGGELEPREQRRGRRCGIEYARGAIEHREWCADVVQVQSAVDRSRRHGD
jgi:hypothetical protein